MEGPFAVLLRLTWVDLIMVALWIVIVALGVRTGLIRQLLALAALYVSLIVASSFKDVVGGWLGRVFPAAGPDILRPVAFLLLFVLGAIMISSLAAAAYSDTRLANFEALDRFGGGVTAAILGVLLVATLMGLLYFVGAVDWPAGNEVRISMRHAIENSVLQPMIRSRMPLVYQVLGPWMPSEIAIIQRG